MTKMKRKKKPWRKGPRCAVPSVGRRGEQDLARECARVRDPILCSLSVCSFYLLRTPSRHPSPHNPDPFVLTVPSHHHHHHPNQASDLALIRTSQSRPAVPPHPHSPTHLNTRRTGLSIPLPPSQHAATTILSRPSPAHTGGSRCIIPPPTKPSKAGHPSRAVPSQSITTPHILRPRH